MALETKTPEGNPPGGRTEEFRQLLRYARPYRTRLIAGVAAMAVVGFTEGLVPLMVTPAIDSVLKRDSQDSRVPLVKLPFHGPTIYLNSFVPHAIRNVGTIFALCLVVLFVVKAMAEYFGSVEIQYVGLAAITDLRNEIYEKLVRQPIGFFQKQATGRLISGVINDVERARSVLSDTLAQGFRYVFSLFFLVLVLLVADWKMAVCSAVFVPIVLFPVRTLGRKIRKSVESSQSRLGELTQILQETFSGNRVVKAFGMERFEIGRFHEAARRLVRENMRWIRAQMVTPPLMDILSAFVVIPILLYARSEINRGAMTVGIFFTFVIALFKAYEPVKGLGNVYQQFEQAHGATAKVFSFLQLQEEVQQHPAARPLPPFSRQVEFENVSFGYDPDTPILRGIRLQARSGEVLAIVGSSGAGKTTLVNLLPRFYDVTGGRLLIDGLDVREVTLSSLREQMAIVTQETILFHDTVWNNICYGQSDLSEETVHAAARAALAHDFITELPRDTRRFLASADSARAGASGNGWRLHARCSRIRRF